MRILDDNNNEITDPDLTIGELFYEIWASPEAYKTIDNVNKFVLDDNDYEEIQRYHIWTIEELTDKLKEKEIIQKDSEYKDTLDTLPKEVDEISKTQDDLIIVLSDLIAT